MWAWFKSWAVVQSLLCRREMPGFVFSVSSSSETTISIHTTGSFGICFYIVTLQPVFLLLKFFSLFIGFSSSLQSYPSFTTPHSICTHFPFPLPAGSDIVITGALEIFSISMEWFISAIHQVILWHICYSFHRNSW